MAVSTLSVGGAKAFNTVTASAIAQELTFTFVADVSGDSASKYFLLSSTTTKYYVWMNPSSTGTDPALPGMTGIAVAYSSNATAATIASAAKTAIAAVGGAAVFSCGLSSATVYVKNQTAGLVSAPPSVGNSSYSLGLIEPGAQINNAAGNGMVYLFTTPSTADYVYEVVLNQILPTNCTSPLSATIAAPLKVGPSTPIYLPITWSASISGTPGQVMWSCNGYKIT